MPDLATVNEWLAEAWASRHQLMLGRSVVTMTHTLQGSNGVSFQARSVADIDRYIAKLTDMRDSILAGRTSSRRAFYIH